MITIRYNAFVYRENDRYVAQCLEIDISSHGSTADEALNMLREAVSLADVSDHVPSFSVDHVRHTCFDLSYA